MQAERTYFHTRTEHNTIYYIQCYIPQHNVMLHWATKINSTAVSLELRSLQAFKKTVRAMTTTYLSNLLGCFILKEL